MATAYQYASGGLALMKAFGSYIAASKQAKADKAWQRYNNIMTRLQDAQNQNALTFNWLQNKDQTKTRLAQIDKSEIATKASAEVAAAATGTIGRSVNQVLFDIGNNAANAREAVRHDDALQDAQIQNQRMQSALQTEMQLDMREINGPSLATSMLGLGGDLFKIFNKE